MTLVRWFPFREMANMHGQLNRMFADETHAEEEGCGAWTPAVDIIEKGDDLVIRAELPGVDRDDIEVNADNGKLVLRGERKREVETNEHNVYRLERVYGTFSRSFSLPKTVDASQISATYKDGVLEVVLPKSEEAKPRKVRIEAA